MPIVTGVDFGTLSVRWSTATAACSNPAAKWFRARGFHPQGRKVYSRYTSGENWKCRRNLRGEVYSVHL